MRPEKKAAIGMALTGTSVGTTSEGSFGPDPFGAFMPWNTEVVLWVDRLRDLEVEGVFHAHRPQGGLLRQRS